MYDTQKKKQLLTELLAQSEKVRKENVFKSSALGKPAYNLAEELKDYSSMAKAMYYIYIGTYYGKKDNNMHLIHQALQWIHPDEAAFVVRLNNLLGIENMKRGCYAASANYFAIALEVAEKSGDPEMLYLILNNTGELFSDIGDFKQALAYYHEAYEYAQVSQGDELEDLGVFALDNLVESYCQMEDFTHAKYYLGLLENVYEQTVCTYTKTRFAYAKACYLKSIHEHDKAIQIFSDFLNQIKNFGTLYSRVEAYRHIGDCYESLGKDNAAIECYMQVLEHSAQTSVGHDELHSLRCLSRLYKNKNNIDESLHYHEIFSRKMDERQAYSEDMCSKYILQRMQFNQLKEAKSFVEEKHRRVIEDHRHVSRAYKRLDLAVTIGNALATNPTFTGLLALLHDQVMTLMPLASISIGRYSEKTKLLKLAYIIDGQGVRDDIVLDVGRPEPFYMKTCIEERASLMFRKNEEFIYKPLEDYPLQEAYNRIQSALYVPVVSDNMVKGVVSVQSREPYAYNSEDLKVLEIIAAYFAQINFDN